MSLCFIDLSRGDLRDQQNSANYISLFTSLILLVSATLFPSLLFPLSLSLPPKLCIPPKNVQNKTIKNFVLFNNLKPIEHQVLNKKKINQEIDINILFKNIKVHFSICDYKMDVAYFQNKRCNAFINIV